MKEKFLNSSMNLVTKNKTYSNDEIEMIKYGLEAIYLTVSKLIVIFGLAYYLNILAETFILTIFFNIIRSKSFGLHATKSIYCLISSTTFFVGGAYLCKYVTIPNYISIIISIICTILLFKYAPADTHKRPLINKKKREQFKLHSTILGSIYTIIIILFSKYKITNYLLIGMIESVLMILPISYKMFNLPYDNYKNYGV